MQSEKDSSSEQTQADGKGGSGRIARLWSRVRNATGWRRAAMACDIALVALACILLARLVGVFALRLAFPFELEWMEGAVVDHVRRVLDGQALFREPSVTFTPYIYTPLYYHVSAAVCRVTGLGLFGPRLVSTLATVGSLALMASFIRRESGDTVAAVVGCGWFASTFALTGFWLDIARVDSLALLLSLAAVWVARFGRSAIAAAAAGLILAAAFFTKQSALAFVAPLAYFSLQRGWKPALTATAAFLVPTTLVIVGANHASDGWFTYYVFEVPGQHEVLWDRWFPLLSEFFLRPVTFVSILAVLALVVRPRFLRPRYRTGAYLVWLLAALGSSYSSLLHRDGFVNVLIPGYAVLAIVAALGYAWIRQQPRDHPSALGSKGVVVAAVGWAVAAASLPLDWHRAVPTEDDVRAGRAMVESLRNQPGSMLMPGTGWFAFHTGHESVAHAMALADVFKTREPQPKGRLREDLLASIRSRRWAVVILDPSFSLLGRDVEAAVRKHYRRQGTVYPKSAERAGWPKTGFHTRPGEIWVPR